MTRAAVSLALLSASPPPASQAPAPAPDDAAPAVAFTIGDPRITDSSGLAASALHPGVFWTHDNGPDGAFLHALGPDGRTLATVTLEGAGAHDWGAVAAGRDEAGRPALYVTAVGDNRSVTVYRIDEPRELVDETVVPVRFRVRFSDGPHDTEALMVDPRTNMLSMASKEATGGLYVQPAHLSTSAVNVFTRVPGAVVPPFATGGAFSPDGSRFVVRDDLTAVVYATPQRQTGVLQVPAQTPGQSAAFTADGRALLMGTDGRDSEVWRVPLTGDQLPDAARPPVAPEVSAAGKAAPGTKAAAMPSLRAGGTTSFISVIVLLVAMLGVVGWRRARRHH